MKEKKTKTPIELEFEAVAVEIQEVLEKHDYALQPYMIRTEYMSGPAVRLVKLQEDEENKSD